ncbi:MAG: YidB family protein [Gaiellaceae bacterium]
MAITPQELEQAVGTEEIDQIAKETGASPEETKEVLAQARPEVVDKVTPDGQVPDQAQLDDMLGQLFGQK